MSRSLSLTIPALLALYAVGAVWGAAEGFASFGDAVLNGTYVNAPLPIIALQVLGGVAALRGSRIGAVVALLPCTVSLAAVAFDGDLGHSGLDAGHVAYQVTITAVT